MTEEFQPLLARSQATSNIQPLDRIVSPLLIELVNFGCHEYRRCEEAVPKDAPPNLDISAFLLFRHVLETTDGIQVLLSNSCGTAAIPCARALFEATVSLAFILEDRKLYGQRARQWLFSSKRGEVDRRRRRQPGTDTAKEFEARYRAEFPASTSRPVGATDAGLAEDVRRMDAALQKHFPDIHAEYERVRTPRRNGRPRRPQWYALFGGPFDLRRLAEHVGSGTEYELLYGDWSGLAHGTESARYVGLHEDTQTYDQLRRPTEVRELGLMTALLLLRCIRGMTAHFRPEAALGQWYEEQVRPNLDWLRRLRVSFNVTVVSGEPDDKRAT